MQSSGLSNEDLKALIAENAKASKSILKLVQANAKAIEALSDMLQIDKYVDSTNKSLQDLINVVVQLHTKVEEVSPAKKGGRSATGEVLPQAAKSGT